jgi:hypothetical protein
MGPKEIIKTLLASFGLYNKSIHWTMPSSANISIWNKNSDPKIYKLCSKKRFKNYRLDY